MLTPAEADQLILEHMPSFLREDCPLANAAGRILRQDIVADRDLPPFDRVTMDGYALRAGAIAAGHQDFVVEGVQAAGMRALALSPKENACVEVMTGAVLPEGSDCVVPYEDTERVQNTMRVAGSVKLLAGASIHRRGSDHRAGDIMVRGGERVTGRQIAVAAAVGASTLTVAALPKIAVIASGDELVEVDASVAAHQIRRSNDYALRAALQLAGFGRVERFHLRDIRHEIEHRLWHIIAEYEVVLITGGVSKGKFDFLPKVLDEIGVRKIFHGVAQRPGKPFWFGMTPRKTPVFALPGNPVSAYTCLHRYVLPALHRASGHVMQSPTKVVLTEGYVFKPALTCFLPVKISRGERGESWATPAATNTSGDFAGLMNSDGFVELGAERAEFPAGEVVTFRPWI
jgi:molybdopterin molybdotransferase